MAIANSRQAENKMGVQPVGSLLMKMALPMMLSMLAQSLYNVVDSIFVSKISEDALTAVSLAFPVQNLMIAFSVGTGVGINALLSRSLGEKKQRLVNQTATHGLLAEVVTSLAFLLFGLFFASSFLSAQTTVSSIAQMGADYLRIVTVGGTGLFLQVTFERLLQSTGRAIPSMLMQLTGAATNVLFDWLLIFGIGPFPALGVAGAAYATILGQWLAAAVGLILNLRLNHDISLSFRTFRLSGEILRQIYLIGIPSILLSALTSVMTFGMNRLLIRFSETAVALFGIYFKLQSFVFMPAFGLNNAMVPIVAYNYGARQPKRIQQTLRYAMLGATGIMVAGFLIFQCLTRVLMLPFDPSDELLSIGIPAFRRISWCFLVAGVNIIAISSFQAFGNGLTSLLVAVVRQLFLLPAAWLLARTEVLSVIWWAFPIAEDVALLLSAGCLLRQHRTKLVPLLREAAAQTEEPQSAEPVCIS